MLRLFIQKVQRQQGQTMDVVLHRKHLLSALSSFVYNDNDFNGENGEEYLWEEAKALECKSNREYLLKVLQDEKEFPDDETVIATYFRRWLGGDGYYSEYTVEVDYDENGRANFIALAYIHENY